MVAHYDGKSARRSRNQGASYLADTTRTVYGGAGNSLALSAQSPLRSAARVPVARRRYKGRRITTPGAGQLHRIGAGRVAAVTLSGSLCGCIRLWSRPRRSTRLGSRRSGPSLVRVARVSFTLLKSALGQVRVAQVRADQVCEARHGSHRSLTAPRRSAPSRSAPGQVSAGQVARRPSTYWSEWRGSGSSCSGSHRRGSLGSGRRPCRFARYSSCAEQHRFGQVRTGQVRRRSSSATARFAPTR